MVRATAMTAFALLAAASALAGDHAELIRDAIAALDNDYESYWAYTETTVDSDKTTVARFDPSWDDGSKWVLMSIDGRAPTGNELTEFHAERNAESGADDSDDLNRDGPADLFETDSMSLIEESHDHWLFSFVPSDEEFEEGFSEHVAGTLRISKDGPTIDVIDLQSKHPFRPEIGVKISDFGTRMTFARAAGTGPVVPVSIDVRIKARAFLAIGINEIVSTRYSDYVYVGD
jgi:hypothetical protein